MQKGKCVRGFSLVEVLVVAGIMAVISAVALPSFFQGHNQQDLNGSTSQIVSSLRTAQSQAVSQVKGTSWGIHFSNNVSGSVSTNVSSSMGTFLSQFNTNTTLGSSTGQLDYNTAITTDSSGNVYVNDIENYRIDKFDANGNFVKMWGWGVQDGASQFEVCTSGCQGGIQGTGVGQDPGTGGLVYYNGKIYAAGIYDNGSGGTFGRVDVFDATSGNYLSSFGTSGLGTLVGPGQNSIAVDASGNIFVADQWSYRIVEFTSTGTFIKSFGWGVQDGASQFETCTSGCQNGSYSYGEVGAVNSVSGLAVASSGDVFLVDWDAFDTTGVTKFVPSGATYTPSVIISQGNGNTATSSIQSPGGVVLDANENLYVAIQGYGLVKEFDKNGNFMAWTSPPWTKWGTGAGQMYYPTGITLDASGNILTTEGGPDGYRIMKWAPNNFGNWFATIGSAGGNAGQLDFPVDAVTDPSGNVYVADDLNERIDKFDSNGNFIIMWGTGVQDGASSFETCTSGCRAGLGGSGPGEIQHPTGLVYYGGKIYESDGSSRIQVYDATTGNYLSVFGTSGLGTLGSLPGDITVDANGNFYVIDEFHYRVVEYDSTGNFIRTFGWGVQDGASSPEVCTSGCQASGIQTTNISNGGFDIPYQIAVGGPQGNVYVTDSDNAYTGMCRQVSVFSSTGTFVRAIGGPSCDDAPGDFGFGATDGVAVDANGIVYASDYGNARIEAFDNNGTFLGQYTNIGTGQGQITNVWSISLDSSGNLYTTDSSVDHVEKFSPLVTTTTITSVSTSTTSGAYFSIFTGSTYNSANVQSTYPLPSDLAFVTSSVPLGSTLNVIFSPVAGATTAAKIGLYNTINPKLTSWISVGSSGQVTISTSTPGLSFGTFISTFGTSGSGNGQLTAPFGIAVDASGRIYVADNSNNRIEEFSANGVYLSQFGSYGTGNGQFNQPVAVAVDASGNIYVSDFANNRIEKFGSSGNYLSQFGTYGTGAGQLNGCFGLTIDASGNIWVLDGNDHVDEFSSSGTYLSQFGSSGTGNGQLEGPYGLAIDASGNFWVMDQGNNVTPRVEEFSSTGTYLSQFGSFGSGNSQFNDPTGIAIGPNGNIYVVDQGNERIQEFSPSGAYVAKFGSFGNTNGKFNGVQDITFDSAGNLYATNEGNNRVQVFGSN